MVSPIVNQFLKVLLQLLLVISLEVLHSSISIYLHLLAAVLPVFETAVVSKTIVRRYSAISSLIDLVYFM